MTHLRYLLFLVVVQAHAQVYRAQRELIILLDYSQTETINTTLNQITDTPTNTIEPLGLGALSYTLMVALYQEAAPIVAPSTLVHTITAHARLYNDFATLDLSSLRKKYGHYKRFSAAGQLEQLRDHCRYAAQMLEQVTTYIYKYAQKRPLTHLVPLLSELMTDPQFSTAYAPRTLRNLHQDTQERKYYNEMVLYLLCALIYKKQGLYMVKELDGELVVLIPHTYFKKYNLDGSLYPYQKKLGINTLTPAERRFGLKLNHLVDLSFNQVEQRAEKRLRKRQEESCCALTQALTTLYSPLAEDKLSWSIYLVGHGAPSYDIAQEIKRQKELLKLYQNAPKPPYTTLRIIEQNIRWLNNQQLLQTNPFQGRIASLSISEFKKMLQFFNTQVSTALLCYCSCYAGGEHLVSPYKQANGKPLILHYPVIAGALTDSPAIQEVPTLVLPPYSTYDNQGQSVSWNITPDYIDVPNRQLALVTSLKFDHFFSRLHRGVPAEQQPLFELINSLRPYVDMQDTMLANSMGNIASLRKPYGQTFELLLNAQHALMLTSTQAQEIKIAPTQRAIFVYADSVAPSLVIEKVPHTPQPPVVISMVPGKATHVFASISAPDYSFIELINSFLQMPDMASSKVMHIKTLTCKYTPELKQFCASGASGLVTLHNVTLMLNIPKESNIQDPTHTRIQLPDSSTRTSRLYISSTPDKTGVLQLSGAPVTQANAQFKLCSADHYKRDLHKHAPLIA